MDKHFHIIIIISRNPQFYFLGFFLNFTFKLVFPVGMPADSFVNVL